MYGAMKSDVKLDWTWADGHMEAIVNVLRHNAMHLLSVRVATDEQDLKKATDLVIRVDGGDIAVRIRRPNYRGRFRDLTIRSWRASGFKTELEKIKDGFGDWYLYAWSDGQGGLDDWLLVDLHNLRKSGLLDNRRVIKNRSDKGLTGFIAIKDSELKAHGCLVAEWKQSGIKQCSFL